MVYARCKYLFFSMMGFAIFTISVKNHHHHDHCYPFQWKPSIQFYPKTLVKTAMVWFDAKAHRGADIMYIYKCNNLSQFLHDDIVVKSYK